MSRQIRKDRGQAAVDKAGSCNKHGNAIKVVAGTQGVGAYRSWRGTSPLQAYEADFG